jgi:hypothetical protein
VIIFLCDFKNRIGAWRKLGAMSGPVKDATFERSLSGKGKHCAAAGISGDLDICAGFAKCLVRNSLCGIRCLPRLLIWHVMVCRARLEI